MTGGQLDGLKVLEFLTRQSASAKSVRATGGRLYFTVQFLSVRPFVTRRHGIVKTKRIWFSAQKLTAAYSVTMPR